MKIYILLITIALLVFPSVHAFDNYVYGDLTLENQDKLEERLKEFNSLENYDVNVIVHTSETKLENQEINNLFFEAYNLDETGAAQLNVLITLDKTNEIHLKYAKHDCDMKPKMDELMSSKELAGYLNENDRYGALMLLVEGIEDVLKEQIDNLFWCQKKESSGFAYWNYIFLGIAFVIVLIMIFLIIKLRKNKLMNQNYNNKLTRRQF